TMQRTKTILSVARLMLGPLYTTRAAMTERLVAGGFAPRLRRAIVGVLMLLARSGLTLVLGLAALLAAAPAAAEPPADKEKQAVTLHDEAWSLYEQGRYRAAIDKLAAALSIDPHGV